MSDTSAERRVIDAVPKQLYIGGSWCDASDGSTFEIVDPSTGRTLCSIADATIDDGIAAIEAAAAAQREFGVLAPRKRADLLMDAFALLHERVEDLALLMTLEMGKSLAESRGEISYAAEFFRHFAEEATRISGGYQVSPAGNARFLLARQPVGPSVLITPWNFPMAMGTRKIGPAIAAGCTSVIKPAPQTPLSMLALASILDEVGVPHGAISVVPTTRAAEVVGAQIDSGHARKLSFTGSTGVGRRLLAQCADKIMRTSMELGGNAPFIVFADADLDAAVDGAMLAKMRNGGEACTAANRFYVHADVVDDFAGRLAKRMSELSVGRGVDDGVQVGPLIDSAAQDKVDSLVADAVAGGAEVLVGGHRVEGDGYFYSPTVLVGVSEDAKMRHDEIFGPVAPISQFTSEDEVIAKANDTEYGLVSYVYTNDLNRALRVAEAIESGMVGINQGVVSNPAAPFGGVKASGLGREGGPTGIDEYLETKYIGIATG